MIVEAVADEHIGRAKQDGTEVLLCDYTELLLTNQQ